MRLMSLRIVAAPEWRGGPRWSLALLGSLGPKIVVTRWFMAQRT